MLSEGKPTIGENGAEPLSSSKRRWRQLILSSHMLAILFLFGLLQYPVVSGVVSLAPSDDLIAVISDFVFWHSLGGLIGWAIGYAVSGKQIGSVIGAIVGAIAVNCLLL